MEILVLVCIVIYCLITSVGTLGNGLVIYVTGFKMKKTVNSIWFLNLAIADFIFTAFLITMTVSAAHEYKWHFGLFMCKFNSFVTTLNMFASVFLLMAISLDRCLSSWVVVWAQNKRTVRKAQLICVFIWLVASACSIPSPYYRDIMKHEGDEYCTLKATCEKKLFITIFRFVVGFIIPFLTITVCYVAIAFRVARMQRTRTKRPRRIILSIILAFFICWLPFHIMMFMESTVCGKDYNYHIHLGGVVSMCLAYFNSCLNPILYVFMCDDFMRKLKQSICHVLESALAEDHLSFVSSRSLSSHFSRITRKSDSNAPGERRDTCPSLTDCKVVLTDKDTMSTENSEQLMNLNNLEKSEIDM